MTISHEPVHQMWSYKSSTTSHLTSFIRETHTHTILIQYDQWLCFRLSPVFSFALLQAVGRRKGRTDWRFVPITSRADQMNTLPWSYWRGGRISLSLEEGAAEHTDGDCCGENGMTYSSSSKRILCSNSFISCIQRRHATAKFFN